MKYLLKKFSTSFLFVFEIHCTSKSFQCFSVDFQESDYMVYSYVILRKVNLKVILIIEIHISDTRVNSLMIPIYVFLLNVNFKIYTHFLRKKNKNVKFFCLLNIFLYEICQLSTNTVQKSYYSRTINQCPEKNQLL